MPRLFLAPDTATLSAGAACDMTAAQARYLGTVLRRDVGSEVALFNARDGEWRATIAHVRRDRGTFAVQSRLRAPETATGPVLMFALLKRDATDLVVRMGTELGVRRFLPVITERTNAARVNVDRLRAIAVEAAEQCERLDVPEVEEPARLTDRLGAWPAERALLIAVERMRDAVSDTDGGVRLADGDGVLIGPEGGFAETELRAILGRPFVRGVSLGRRILRADTAAAATLARFGGF
nr:16S rRNA (uracil(1498)-N(3))-methyltransferase [Ameyamaea chiangmaiensis]